MNSYMCLLFCSWWHCSTESVEKIHKYHNSLWCTSVLLQNWDIKGMQKIVLFYFYDCTINVIYGDVTIVITHSALWFGFKWLLEKSFQDGRVMCGNLNNGFH